MSQSCTCWYPNGFLTETFEICLGADEQLADIARGLYRAVPFRLLPLFSSTEYELVCCAVPMVWS